MTVFQRIGLFCMCLLLAGCNDEVYRNLSARDANEIVAVLRRAEIAATRDTDGGNFKVTVPRGDFGRAVDILNRAGLPREQYRSIGEVFPGDGLIVSPFEQKARLIFAVSQELTKTIKAITGVASARVHVVMPESDLRGGAPSRSSASVVVMHRPRVDTAELSTKIRLIVANAVPELNDRDVSVAFFPAEGDYDDVASASSAFVPSALQASTSSLTWLLWIGAMVMLAIGVGALLFRRRAA